MERNWKKESPPPRFRVTIRDADRARMREAMRPILEAAERYQKVLAPFVEAGERLRLSLAPLVEDLRKWLAPGAEGDDVRRLADTPKRDREKLWDVAQRMSRRVRAGLKDPDAQDALLTEARLAKIDWREYFRERLFAPGLMLARDEMMKPQPVRLGKSWVTGPDGKKIEVVPFRDLDLGEFRDWLVARAYKNTVAALFGDRPTVTTRAQNLLCPACHRAEVVGGVCPRCKTGIPEDEREPRHSRPRIEQGKVEPPSRASGSLTALLSEDSIRKQRKSLAALWASATRRERQFLSLIHTGYEPQVAASKMGLTDGARRALLFRLCKKAAPPK